MCSPNNSYFTWEGGLWDEGMEREKFGIAMLHRSPLSPVYATVHCEFYRVAVPKNNMHIDVLLAISSLPKPSFPL